MGEEMNEKKAKEIIGLFSTKPAYIKDIAAFECSKGYLGAIEKMKILIEALKEIEEAKSKTLLGRCCVENKCIPSEDGASCTLQEKANAAFADSASVARGALTKWKENK